MERWWLEPVGDVGECSGSCDGHHLWALLEKLAQVAGVRLFCQRCRAVLETRLAKRVEAE